MPCHPGPAGAETMEQTEFAMKRILIIALLVGVGAALVGCDKTGQVREPRPYDPAIDGEIPLPQANISTQLLNPPRSEGGAAGMRSRSPEPNPNDEPTPSAGPSSQSPAGRQTPPSAPPARTSPPARPASPPSTPTELPF